jgi:hypothetical protein
MIFDDKSSPNFNFDDPSSFYNLIGKNQVDDMDNMDDMIDMSNPDNHPSWAKEVNEKYAGNRSPASLGLLSEDKMYEMSKLPEPLEDEIEDQENLIKSYKDQGIKDGVQLVPLYEKLGKLREEQKRIKQQQKEPLPSPPVANPSVLPNMREAFDIYKASKGMADQQNRLPQNILNSVNSNKTELPDYLAPSSSQSALYQAAAKNSNEIKLDPVSVSAKASPVKKSPSISNMVKSNKIVNESATSEVDALIEKENAERQNTLDALRAMQGDVDNLKRLQFITEGAEKLSAGIAGVMSGYKVTPEKSKVFDELAEQTQKNYEQRASVEKDDPNSAYSKGFREFAIPFAKRIGFDENKLAKLSGTQIAAVLPQLKDVYEAQVRADAFRLQREELRADRAQRQAERADERAERQIKGLYYSWKNRLPTLGGPAATVNRNRINQADAIFATFNLDRDATEDDINKLDNDQLKNYGRMMITESAIELNKLLSGASAPARKTLEDIVPENIYMDYVKLKDYFTNKLNPAKQSAFIKQVLKVAARVRDNSQGQLTDVYKRDAAGRSMFWNNPEIGPDFDATLRASGLKDEQIQEIKGSKNKSGESISEQGLMGKSSYFPGDIVSIQGKKYRVLEDGDSLEEIK